MSEATRKILLQQIADLKENNEYLRSNFCESRDELKAQKTTLINLRETLEIKTRTLAFKDTEIANLRGFIKGMKLAMEAAYKIDLSENGPRDDKGGLEISIEQHLKQ